MRITHLFVALLAVAGVSAITPASAETSLSKTAPIATPLVAPTSAISSANQYRGRHYRGGYGHGYRGDYGYRGNRGWRRGYYRRNYYAYRPYRWRGRMACRTSWRWGRPHRVCFRRW
ncbi:MAG: hypothetical protein ACTHJR_09815 [Sphingomonas sp.]|uniref:hypothetical protein n=1 Tax=Sphingomonas sp. TaxID=28214 RepID=UPI003F7DBC66